MSNTQTTTQADKNSLSGGQIALIIIGCVLVIGLVAALIAWLVTDKKKKNSSKKNTIQIGGPVNNGVKKPDQQTPQQNNVVKNQTQTPMRTSVVYRNEAAAPTANIVSGMVAPTAELLGYYPQTQAEEESMSEKLEKLKQMSEILNGDPEEEVEKPDKKEEKKIEEKPKQEAPEKNEKPKKDEEKPKPEEVKKEDAPKADKKENNDKNQAVKANDEDEEELDFGLEDGKDAPKPFGDLGLGKMANFGDKKDGPEGKKDTKQDPAKKEMDDAELDKFFASLLSGGPNVGPKAVNPVNKPMADMPKTPSFMGTNGAAPTPKQQPFGMPMPKPQPFGTPMPQPNKGVSGAGDFPNVGLSSPGMLNMGPSNNNNLPKMPLNMTPPPMPMQNNQSVGSLPGVSQNVNPMMHDDRQQNGLSDADFSFSAEENKPKYPPQNQQHQNNNFSAGMPKNMFENPTMNATNNNRSTMGLDTQNKCNCPDCIGNQ